MAPEPSIAWRTIPGKTIRRACTDHLWHKTGSPLHLEAFVEFLELIRPDVMHLQHFLTFGIDLITLTRRVLPDCRIVFTFHEFLAIWASRVQPDIWW